MKNAIKKIAASTICGALLLSMAGCADTSWSVKRNDDEKLSVGTYIYYMNQAYSEAKEKTGKSGNDVLSETIDKKTGDEWIRDRAKELCAEQMTLDKLCQDNKITITDDEIDATYKSQSVFYGYGYCSYYDMWVMSKQSYEAMGISENSYKNAIIKTALEKDKLFNKLYGEGGSKEVKDSELEKYFKENYVSYKYLTTSLNKTDSNGKSTTMTDEEKEVVKAQYERYVKIINEQGKTIDDVAAQYDKDYPSESSTKSSSESSQETTSSASSEKSSQPETTSSEVSTESSTESSNSSTTKSSSVQSSIEDLSNENFVFGDEVKKKLKEMKDNEAAYVATSSAYYFLYKTPIADEVSSALDKNNTSNYRSKILHSIKDDEFDKYIEEQGKKIDYEFNDAAYNKYTPSRVIPDSDNSKDESSKASSESSTESSTESKTSSKASKETSTESKTASEASTESSTESKTASEASKSESSAQG